MRGTVVKNAPAGIVMKTMKLMLSFVFIYLLVNCINLINQEFRLQNYQLMLEEDMKKVQAEQIKLKNDMHYYGTSAGVEELARKRLGYYKKGEIPMRVIETPISSEQVTKVSPLGWDSESDQSTPNLSEAHTQ